MSISQLRIIRYCSLLTQEKKDLKGKQNAKIRINPLKDTPIYKTKVAEKGIHHKNLSKIIRFVNISEIVGNKSGELTQKETKCKADGK